MQRGILSLNHTEVDLIIESMPMDRYAQSPLVNKLLAAAQNTDLAEVNLEISEDELEVILDEIGISPTGNSDLTLKTLRKKISDLMGRFREDHY